MNSRALSLAFSELLALRDFHLCHAIKCKLTASRRMSSQTTCQAIAAASCCWQRSSQIPKNSRFSDYHFVFRFSDSQILKKNNPSLPATTKQSTNRRTNHGWFVGPSPQALPPVHRLQPFLMDRWGGGVLCCCVRFLLFIC